jgi:hypothetical protein
MAIRQGHRILRTVLLAGLAAVIAFAYWWHQRPVDRSASKAPPASATHVSVLWNRPSDNKHESSAQGKSAPVTQAPTSIRQRMPTATDWYALAKDILPQAQAGNPEAQYVLFQTIGGCEEGAESLGAKSENLAAARDKALQLFPNAPELVSKYEAGYKRCHGFYTDDAARLGDPWDWLQKATDAGYAPAQAATAVQRLQQDQRKAFVKAGNVPNDTATLAPIGGDANPRELLVAAVQSADPEVLNEIGQMQGILNPRQPRDVTQLIRTAWMYVACQRGFDCSDYGPGTVTNCGPGDGNCTPVPEQFIIRAKYNWAPVQEMVNQINAALNAKQWDHLPGLPTGG